MEEIPPTHYAASRAASVAENCINYQQGTPHKVFLVQTVQQASKEVSLRDGEAQRIGLPCYSHPDPGWAGLGWGGGAPPRNSIPSRSSIWYSPQNCLLSQ